MTVLDEIPPLGNRRDGRLTIAEFEHTLSGQKTEVPSC